MLPLISYDVKKEADRGSSLWEYSTRGPQRILSMGFYCSEDPQWDPHCFYLFIRLISDPFIEKKRQK